MKSRFKLSLFAKVGLFFCIAASLNTSTHAEEGNLSEHPWNSPELVELFVNAAHSREACELDFSGCRVALQKRVENYHLVVRGENSFISEDIAQIASDSLSKVLSDIAESTGLIPVQEAPEQETNFVFLVFFNEDEYDSDPENYIMARVAPPSFSYPQKRRQAFEWFRTSHLDCMYLTIPYPDGIIRDAQIWVKVDISPANMSKCITEEIFNSFGLDDTDDFLSIFDWPSPGSRPSSDEKIVTLSDLHLLYLRRLYSQDMLPNQAEQDTRERLQQY